MDFVPPKDSPDKSDLKPSFRKPSNDSTNRKYRHHSPVDGSDSSSSGVGSQLSFPNTNKNKQEQFQTAASPNSHSSATAQPGQTKPKFYGTFGSRRSPKHEQHVSPGNSSANRSKVSDDKAKYHGKEPERDLGHGHSSRGSDSYRFSDKQAYRSSRDYQHSGGYHRPADDDDKYSKYGRELRSGRPDCTKHNDSFEKSKETNRNTDRNAERYYSRDKYENSGHRSRGKDREVNATDHRYNEIDSSTSRRDNKRFDERERVRGRDDRDDRKIRHRSPNDHRKEYSSIPEDSRGHTKDSFIERESVGYRLKESQQKEIDDQDCQVQKRRYNDKDTKKYDEKYSQDPEKNSRESDSFSVYRAGEEKSDSYVNKNSNSTEEPSSSKRLKLRQSDKFPLSMAEGKQSSSSNDATEKFTLGPTDSVDNHTEAAQDLNAAKVAAMKAAELVNRNLVGTGFLSTDQKKKLLWGSKKSSSEESGNRWDLQLFPDRERQEKFNKLMGVKGGEAVPQERKPDERDVEKQKELQMDLEKQYTAGLRRRDGRTVGLGL